jgi:hypothetical protein
MGPVGQRAGAPLLLAFVAALGACGDPAPAALPTIGSPSPSASAVPVDTGRAAELAREWDLEGAELPADWPDVPLPAGTEVVTAYAIGAEPRRTWTATFAADRGTALDLAEPVVAELRSRGYRPIAEYVGAASTNTGLYSFAAPTFAVYVVLGEDDGRPNLVITVRGSTNGAVPLPSDLLPSGPGSLAPTPSASGPTTTQAPADASDAPSTSPTAAPTASP